MGEPPFCALGLELLKGEGSRLSACRVGRGNLCVSLSTLDCGCDALGSHCDFPGIVIPGPFLPDPYTFVRVFYQSNRVETGLAGTELWRGVLSYHV